MYTITQVASNMKLPRKVSKWTVIHYRQRNPCLTGASIARKFSISRERVRQILSDAGRSTVSNHYGLWSHCSRCGRVLSSKAELGGVCRECFHEVHTVLIVCANCGKLVERYQSSILDNSKRFNIQHLFCSRDCSVNYHKVHRIETGK